MFRIAIILNDSWYHLVHHNLNCLFLLPPIAVHIDQLNEALHGPLTTVVIHLAMNNENQKSGLYHTQQKLLT